MFAPRRLAASLALPLAVLAVAASAPAHAADAYPNHPITLVVPFAPGGYTDVVARLLADKMGASLGQAVVVDNRPGAGSSIGTKYLAHAKNDGYTVGLVSLSLVIAPYLYHPAPFDPMKDFAPVAKLAEAPSVLVVNPQFPPKNVAEMIALAKAQPNTIGYASSGNGSTQQLVGAYFAWATGTKLSHVPYKGSNQSIVDVVGGVVQTSFVGISNALQLVRSGRLRALAVTSAQRAPELPEVPTLVESGVKGAVITGWLGMVAPAGTPPEIIARLRSESAKALSAPGAKSTLSTAGVDLSLLNETEFDKLLKSESERWGKVIRETGARVD